jgi:hypothetical protein
MHLEKTMDIRHYDIASEQLDYKIGELPVGPEFYSSVRH